MTKTESLQVLARQAATGNTAVDSPAPALASTQLCGGYGRERVVDSFSFEFLPGRVYGLLGANGAGKSTLLRLLAAILLPVAGEVRLEGRPIGSLSARQRARLLAMVPQMAQPVSSLRVSEALALARLPYSSGPDPSGQQCIDAATRAMGLEELLEQDCDRLSGGQWRRLLTAQGLAQLGSQGGVLLLDEPGAFLDPPARSQLFDRLRREASENSRCIVVTLHDLPAAGEHCDELLLLKAGRLLAHGAPEMMLQPGLLAELYSAGAGKSLLEVA